MSSGKFRSGSSNQTMTRAVVANLNRQRPSNEAPSTPPSSSKGSKTPSPQKSLPPQPAAKRLDSKDLPEVPEYYVVRPAPSMSGTKVERNDRRVFINRGTMEKINLCQGSVVLVQRHDSNRWTKATSEAPEGEEEEDGHYAVDEELDTEEMTVGVAWPMNRIEPNGTDLLRAKLTNGCENGIVVTTVCSSESWRSCNNIALPSAHR
jgi:hypothetical protein